MLQKGRDQGREVRGLVEHGFCRSIYFRDPNGYGIELSPDAGEHREMIDPTRSHPHAVSAEWQRAKRN
jgi:catechol-2,3-dioxygenase